MNISVVLMGELERSGEDKVRKEECSGLVRHHQRRHDVRKYCFGNVVWRRGFIYGQDKTDGFQLDHAENGSFIVSLLNIITFIIQQGNLD